ncbi:hypothetical protein [Curtobacterium sp. UNCCL17]|uniref:hypothetical protein n=1 Tax=Curtobacterium sp. UNCCL17 TaxID=1449051 RepID=UPI0012DF3ED4|nr:hypothetical protein [Curtobacterium sp. UNCCL17]
MHGSARWSSPIAAQVAVTCYSSGRQLAADPSGLVDKISTAFECVQALNLWSGDEHDWVTL